MKFLGTCNLRRGLPWPNRYSGCTTNVYNLDAYAGVRGFDPETSSRYRAEASARPMPSSHQVTAIMPGYFGCTN